MTLEEKPVVPRVSTTSVRFLLIGEIEIAENCSARGIGRNDFRAAVNDTLTLIKINCLGDVSRNDGIVLPVFAHAVYLDCQRNRNAIVLQLPGKIDNGGSAPAMAEQYDWRPPCFVRRTNAVQPIQGRNAGLFSLAVCEKLNPCAATICFLQTPGKLNFRMANVVFMYETADEAYHQCRGRVVIPATVLVLIGGGISSLA